MRRLAFVAVIAGLAGCGSKDPPASTIVVDVKVGRDDLDTSTVRFFRGTQVLSETHTPRDDRVMGYRVTVPVPAKEWLATDLRYEGQSACGNAKYDLMALFPLKVGLEHVTHEGELAFRLDGAKTPLDGVSVAPSPLPSHDLTLDIYVDNRGGAAGRLRTVEGGFESGATDVGADATGEVKVRPARCGKPIDVFVGSQQLGSITPAPADPKKDETTVLLLADLQGQRCYRLFEHSYKRQGPGPSNPGLESNEPVYLRDSRVYTLPRPLDDAFKASPDSLYAGSTPTRLELLPWDCTKVPKKVGAR